MKAPTKTLLQSVAGTVLFAGIHSLLASDAAKGVAARVMGPGSRNGYRAAYNAQAAATSIGLYLWLRRIPSDELVYEFQPPAAYAMRAGQAAAAVQLARCVYAVRLAEAVRDSRGRVHTFRAYSQRIAALARELVRVVGRYYQFVYKPSGPRSIGIALYFSR